MNETLTLTTHNKKGVKSTRHQDRTKTDKAKHIKHDMSKYNIYWQWDSGITDKPNFEECELLFYKNRYSEMIKIQNLKNLKSRHKERNKTVNSVYNGKFTSPTETYLQVGNMQKHIDGQTMLKIMGRFQREMHAYDKNYHILDIALHNDEQTPHIAFRSIIDYDDKGVIKIGQDKGLKEMGFELPEPTKGRNKTNNRRITFDKYCRDKLISICKSFDIDIEYIGDGHEHKEKEEYIKFEEECKTIDKMLHVAKETYLDRKQQEFNDYKNKVDEQYYDKLEKCGLGRSFGIMKEFGHEEK